MNNAIEMIPEHDRAILAGELKLQREKLPEKTAEQFMQDILWRVFTEICCERRGYRQEYWVDAGNAYKQWVDDEVHHALEGMDVRDTLYAETYQRIVRGVAARAIDLFNDWEGKTYPKTKEDHRNLRASLQSFQPSEQPFEPIPVPVPEPQRAPDVDMLLALKEDEWASRIHSFSPRVLRDLQLETEKLLGGHQVAAPFMAALALYGAAVSGNMRTTRTIVELDEEKQRKLRRILDLIAKNFRR